MAPKRQIMYILFPFSLKIAPRSVYYDTGIYSHYYGSLAIPSPMKRVQIFRVTCSYIGVPGIRRLLQMCVKCQDVKEDTKYSGVYLVYICGICETMKSSVLNLRTRRWLVLIHTPHPTPHTDRFAPAQNRAQVNSARHGIAFFC